MSPRALHDMPLWMKNRRTAVMNIVKRRLKQPLPPFEEADRFLASLERSVLNTIGDGGYPGHLREFHDVAEYTVEVRGDVNTPESMARGELRVQVSYVLITGRRFTFTVGYVQEPVGGRSS